MPWGCLVLVSLMGVTYVADDLWSHFRRHLVEQIRVDRIYATGITQSNRSACQSWRRASTPLRAPWPNHRQTGPSLVAAGHD